MEVTTMVPGQRVLLDRSSIKQFVVANNALFNKRIQNVQHQDF